MKKFIRKIMSVIAAVSIAVSVPAFKVCAAAESTVDTLFSGTKTKSEMFFVNLSEQSGAIVYLAEGAEIDLKYFAKINDSTEVTSSNSHVYFTRKNNSIYMSGTMTEPYTINGKTYRSATFADVTITNGSSSKTFQVEVVAPSATADFKLKLSNEDIHVGETFTITGSNDSDHDWLTWTATNDNIRIMTEFTGMSNEPMMFKALRAGKTTVYCLSASGVARSIDLNIGYFEDAAPERFENAHAPSIKADYHDGYTLVWFDTPAGTTLRCTYDGTHPTAVTPQYSGNKFRLNKETTFNVRVEKKGYKPAVYSFTKSIIGNSFETLEKTHSRLPYYNDHTKHPEYLALSDAEKKAYIGVTNGEIINLYYEYKKAATANGHTLTDKEDEAIKLKAARHFGLKEYDDMYNIYRAKRLIKETDNSLHGFNDEAWDEYFKSEKLTENEAVLAKKKARKIVEKALKEKTPFDQIKSIHDSVCKIAKYDYDLYDYHRDKITYEEYKKKHPETNSILVNGLGVCDDYSRLFALLCNAAGYECATVGGVVSKELHGWNIIKLEGAWYYIDVTWDDNDNSIGYTYFLKGDDTMRSLGRKSYGGYVCDMASKSDYENE